MQHTRRTPLSAFTACLAIGSHSGGRTFLSSFSFAAPRCPRRSRRSSQAPRRHRGRNGIGLLLQSGANRAPAGYGPRTSTTNNENGRNVTARGVRLYREPQTNDDRQRSPFKAAMHLSRASDFTRERQHSDVYRGDVTNRAISSTHCLQNEPALSNKERNDTWADLLETASQLRRCFRAWP